MTNTMRTHDDHASTTSWTHQTHAERSRTATRPRTLRTRDRHRGQLANTVVVFLLLVMAALSHGPVFGDWRGYIAALGGVLLGSTIALVCRRLTLGWISSAMTLFVAYILIGGALALPQTTLYSVVPTLRTVQTLVVGIIASWKDLLTVQPPAGVFIGPAVMPYLAATLTSFVAITITTRTRRQLWALLPVGILLLTGILWGSQHAPLAHVIGPCVTIVGLIWASRVTAYRRTRTSHGTVEFAARSRRTSAGRWAASIIMIALATAAAIIVNVSLSANAHRTVLRDYIEPPLDLREYHSPVSVFRHWNTTDKDTKLLTVAGQSGTQRITLATLDYYDGTVFQVASSQASASFRHVGRVFTDSPLPPDTPTHTVEVRIEDYVGHWVPGVGRARGLQYTGERADELADSLYYSDQHETGLSTLKLRSGAAYRVHNITSREWSDDQLQGRGITQYPIPIDQNVPSVLAEKAAALVADSAPGLPQVRAIEQALHTQGFYSDGSDGLSLPGHRADRLDKFISANQMIGDDDQYAPTMALMLRSLGIPSRVVMGFFTDTPAHGNVTFTGKDSHLWVEVPFDGAGWVPFFPTPPRDQVPQTEVPKPKPNPTPQVLQPPEPPEEPAEAPLEVVDEPEDDEEADNPLWPLLILAAQVAGGTLLALSPWLLLVLIKARRRKRRRTKGRHDMRAAGAWDEMIDRATDLGVPVPIGETRRNQVHHIEAALDGQDKPARVAFRTFDEERSALEDFAAQLDLAVFGEAMPDDESCTALWASGKRATRMIRKRVPWYRRLRASFSTRSLRVRRIPWRVRLKRFADRSDRLAHSDQFPTFTPVTHTTEERS